MRTAKIKQQEQQRIAVGTRKRAVHVYSPGGVRRSHDAALHVRPAAVAAATAVLLLLLLMLL